MATLLGAAGPIMVEASKARRHLRELCDVVLTKTQETTVPEGVHGDAKYLTGCLDRFNIWAGSLGVFQKGEASLDARLSNHMLAREVIRLLKQLDAFTLDLRQIVDGERQQSTWTESSLQLFIDEFSDDLSASSDDEEEGALTPETDENDPASNTGPESDGIMTESMDLHFSVNESVTSLLRLSIQVHKSSRKSKFAKSSVDQNYAIGPDISHVRDAFPYLEVTQNDTLAVRLGKANAQRRQWLWYRRRHREKLSVDHSGTLGVADGGSLLPPGIWDQLRRDGGDGDDRLIALFSVDDVPSGSAAGRSFISGTKASTYRSHFTGASLLSPSIAPPDTLFERSSRATRSEQKLLVPEPPHDLVLGQPYFCRYCCNIIEISGKNAWQRHVYSDLSAYTCLSDTCEELFFESRGKWWAHEMTAHRKKWLCGLCQASLSSFGRMKDHIRVAHTDVRSDQISDLAHKFGRPVTFFDASECPLCDYSNILHQRGLTEDEIRHRPAEKFGLHLARHLEQLALFVLPNTDLIDEDDGLSGAGEGDSDSDGNDSDSEQVETLSDPDLIEKLAQLTVKEGGRDPKMLADSPDLAMRWQPPQDFTPPLEDFDAEDADSLPVRQEPIFGGDLHTPGWARGHGSKKEGFCARCPVSHWVNIADGSYRFHLTYFHGCPDSGVPLPRPSTIRPVSGEAKVWEAFCDACSAWRILKKTKRGWNWYRHWLTDHKEIVEERTQAVRSGNNPDVTPQVAALSQDPRFQALEISPPGEMADTTSRFSRLVDLAKNDQFEQLGIILKSAVGSQSRDDIRSLANKRTDKGETLLMLSAAHGSASTVQLLLDLGADPNVTAGGDSLTALDIAVDAGYFTIAQHLVARGADTSQSHVFKKIMSNDREYAGENTTEAVKSPTATAGASLNAVLRLGRAALAGDTDAAIQLLGNDDSGPSRYDIEEGDAFGCAPFLLASTKNHYKMMDLLLSRGANINTTSKHGWTPLMLASKRGDVDCVNYLLQNGADVNHLSPDRWTALAEATNNGFIAIMRLLLDAGADPEIRAQSDWAPLMHAAYRGDLEAVNILLESGASFEEISARDETVMLLAAAAGSASVVRRLLEAGCPPESTWSKSLMAEPRAIDDDPFSSESTETAALKLQERIERVYKVGWTPLMVACQVGSLDIVALLLDAGANYEPKSPMFKTALEIAKENGRTEVAEYLEKRLGS
ncbi:hypothetical protein B0T21DRAFT_306459 [Apiosordaria backusii]|uniref:C2H2-type domain-containing protein n=1 Tax=Apiosordaria backusii TaxID=314023 RepID=A0AA40EML6_9PEZI|nr:hypothetical protein B0T21DRAFT_306459 [Apiosordaria backusii]